MNAQMRSSFSSTERGFMSQALELARRGMYTTDPNPRVGCVLARGDEVVGEGWHSKAGEAHAERIALESAGDSARGATAFVTLEPCSHTGRTPPCTDALAEAGVARVVAAMRDPNPAVNGSGLAAIESAGIEVAVGLLEEEATELNPGFVSRMQLGRPWVRLKMAMSLDGRTAMASGESQWITGKEARADVHRWRARSSAILTGVGTVIADDPRMTARVPEADRQPLRVVVDSQLRTPANARLFESDAPVLIATTQTGAPGGLPCEVLATNQADDQADDEADRVDLNSLMTTLAQREINEIWVEAGARLGGALLQARLVDELIVYVAPRLLGSDARALFDLPHLERLQDSLDFHWVDWQPLGDDLRLRLRPVSAPGLSRV